MSFKKRSSSCLLAVGTILATVLFVLPSCQGPAGVAGKDGATMHDTIVKYDTLKIFHDTIIRIDSTIYIDSVIHDTVHFDTTIYDTTIFKDTSVNIDTLLMSSNCVICHSSNQEMASKQYQLAETKHSIGETFLVEGSNTSCVQCHNGAVYVLPLTAAQKAAAIASPSNVNCRTCHTIHTKYDTTDWKLTGPDSVKLIPTPTVYAKVGKGNLCAVCHQSRTDENTTASRSAVTTATPPVVAEYGLSDTSKAGLNDSIYFTNSRIGPHHGPQLNTVLGIGGYENTTYVAKPAAGTFGLHATLVKDGCVTCHLGTKQSHTFVPEVATCNTTGCHGNNALVPAALSTTVALDALPQQMTIDSLKSIVRDTLIAHKIAKLDTTATASTSITGILIQAGTTAAPKKFQKKDVALLFNYVTVCEDKSRGVHNFKYTKFILESALEGARH